MYMHVVIAETLDATVLIPEMIAKYFWQTEFTVQLGVYSLRDLILCLILFVQFPWRTRRSKCICG